MLSTYNDFISGCYCTITSYNDFISSIGAIYLRWLHQWMLPCALTTCTMTSSDGDINWNNCFISECYLNTMTSLMGAIYLRWFHLWMLKCTLTTCYDSRRWYLAKMISSVDDIYLQWPHQWICYYLVDAINLRRRHQRVLLPTMLGCCLHTMISLVEVTVQLLPTMTSSVAYYNRAICLRWLHQWMLQHAVTTYNDFIREWYLPKMTSSVHGCYYVWFSYYLQWLHQRELEGELYLRWFHQCICYYL